MVSNLLILLRSNSNIVTWNWTKAKVCDQILRDSRFVEEDIGYHQFFDHIDHINFQGFRQITQNYLHLYQWLHLVFIIYCLLLAKESLSAIFTKNISPSKNFLEKQLISKFGIVQPHTILCTKKFLWSERAFCT